MTRIGLTQRVSVVEAYGERRDCLDQQWMTLLETFGVDPIALPNRIDRVEAYLDSLALDGLILTSGNDLSSLARPSNPAPERDRFEEAALSYAIEEGIPVLGVCRGLQFINTFFGGALSEVTDHVDHTHSVTLSDVAGVPGDIEVPQRITVNSFHNYGITPDDIGQELTIVGTADDNTVEWLVHERLPICGVMWHPERESPSADLDRQLIERLFQTGSND